MLHNEARKLVLEAWDKTHNAREIAKYFSVNESTVYRLIEERARTGSYETRTQLRDRKTILTEKQHHDILELVQEQPDITMKEFARNIKMEAEFPNSQRNMLYRKRAFSGSCAAQQQTEKIRSQSSSSRSAVQQEIIDCSDYIKMVQKARKIKVFRAFAISKRADMV